MVTLVLALACGTGSGDTDDSSARRDTAEDTGDSADIGPDPDTLDQDGDGYRPLDGDCDDHLPHVYPGAPDYCDGLDQDCDGEPIPPGSCGQAGDAGAMWSWAFEDPDASQGVYGSMGDVDGDGRADIAARRAEKPDYHPNAGPLFGAQLDALPPAGPLPELPFSTPHTLGGASGAGDVDGDGYSDIWASEAAAGGRPSWLHLVPGRPEGYLPGESASEQSIATWVLEEGVDASLWGGIGDFDGDGNTDLLWLYERDGADEPSTFAVVGGDLGFLGGSDFDPYPHTVYDIVQATNTTGLPSNVGDLDGDGSDELCVAVTFSQGASESLVMLAGIDLWRGEGTVASLGEVSWLDNEHPHYLTPTTYVVDVRTDADGDGLEDLAVGVHFDDGESGALFYTSGGIPEGRLDAWTHTTIEGLPQTGWVLTRDGDGDGDGVADSILWNNCLLPSSRLLGGGAFDYAEVVGPCIAPEGLGYTNAFADMTGDGQPEWVLNDLYGAADGNNRVLVVEGFPIPWDDPSKW